MTIAVSAPTTSGNYVLRHRMLKQLNNSQVTWFNQILKANVTVSP